MHTNGDNALIAAVDTCRNELKSFLVVIITGKPFHSV